MSLSATSLDHVRVHDVMHTGLLTTAPTTPLRVVARLMAEQHVHAVAVADPDHVRRPFGIVSVLDVAAAAAAGIEETAAQAASTEVVTVTSAEPVSRAARTMAEHGVSHLIVIDPSTGHPCGVISALDIAAAYAA